MSTSLGQMPSLADLSYLFDNEKNAIKLLQQLGVFTTEKKSTLCQYGIQSVNGGSLRCNKCHQRCSFFNGKFFQIFKLPFSQIFERRYISLNNIRVILQTKI